MKIKTHRICEFSECDVEFKKFRSTDKFCSPQCKKKHEETLNKKPKEKPKPIPKVSKKQSVLNSKYSVLRIQYLSKPENKFCFVENCGKLATTIEHRMGRKGFADDWARDNNVPLTIDERFFAPCCQDHNLEFERNHHLSKKYQLSKIHGGKKDENEKSILYKRD